MKSTKILNEKGWFVLRVHVDAKGTKYHTIQFRQHELWAQGRARVGNQIENFLNMNARRVNSTSSMWRVKQKQRAEHLIMLASIKFS